MIHSMTGFGEAQFEEDGHAYSLEIRSVNNRYLKTSIHLHDEFAFLESDVERLLRQHLTRGSVTLRLFVRDLTASAALEINAAAIQTYVEQLRAASPDDARFSIDLATLATLPGACQPRELTDSQREQHWRTLEKLATDALGRLSEMRAVEGRALQADLRTHCARIKTHLAAIHKRAPLVVDEYRERLSGRVRELLAKSNVQLAETDLLKEVAVYAERSDISEELSRLAAHLDQFEGALGSQEPAGRKLDFIAQEMLREANTIGSKAGDAQIARDIIDVKSAIDRIKEQVQNVE